mmetsp:Transcript_75264/g.156781  ORF Transcript_75264/g.156781 Transcript_75264/m.156781 type:complete len:214 (+) Transcript_75264:323-964(+)|eukprot:CAMPEP_0206478742 /NCGR_PEP_ID=MMETSP0324_2-20121206/36254_1 /ASSEMBLY_ACC=CAM_ASM_000836 /TAXON_ID=2866 /ORGANISM="Crypthecodinium cohnii, Strain Seligo" /LENGTH=213 /DNA_ID=CAMNT_0053955145 /DNA_START=245 /DNA_END=886 /DNA_ORIENTATION=+
MFFQCCCGPPPTAENITLDSTSDERLATAFVNADVSPPADAYSPGPTLLRSTPASSDSTARVKSEGPRRRKSVRSTEEDVGQFRSSVAAGRPCVVFFQDVLDLAMPAQRKAALYHISNEDRELLLEFGPGKPPVRCPIDGIEDIYQLADGEEVFPAAVLLSVEPQELDQLLMVVYHADLSETGTGEPEKFCFLERSPEARDALLDCLREVVLG